MTDLKKLTFVSSNPLLDGNVELEAYEADDLMIVTHKSIKALFKSKLLLKGVKTRYELLFNSPERIAIKCSVSDGNVELEEIGDIMLLSLDNEIQKNNASIIAGNRAFDRAIISYLMLDEIDSKTIYSDVEINPYKAENKASKPQEKAKFNPDGLIDFKTKEEALSYVPYSPFLDNKREQKVKKRPLRELLEMAETDSEVGSFLQYIKTNERVKQPNVVNLQNALKILGWEYTEKPLNK